MRNHRRAWLAILFLAALATLIWVFLSAQSEPVYQGKPLRKWLALYTPSELVLAPDDPVANEALRHIGTNAIPTLLEMLQEKDSPLKTKWMALLQKQHFIQPPLPAWVQNNQAVWGFQALGATASNAVPTLLRVYRRKISVSSQQQTLEALGAIGPPALPAGTPVLLDGLTNSILDLRANAASAIGQIHGQPEVFVPALINALKDSDYVVRLIAAEALAAYGPDSKPAIPGLVALMNDPNPYVCLAATNALKTIDPVAGMPALINALKDSDAYVRINAARTLARYGPAAKSAAPALVALLNDPISFVRREATNVLKSIDPVAAANAGIK